jgi:hypothetical protein
MRSETASTGFHHAEAIGFAEVIAVTKAKVSKATTLREAALVLASLGGYQDPAAVFASLTTAQAKLVDAMGDVLYTPCDSTYEQVGAWYVGLWSYGRIYLSPNLPEDERCEVVGCVCLSPDTWEFLLKQQQEDETKQVPLQQEMEHAYELLGVNHILESARFMLDHIEPSMFFLNNSVYSNFGPVNNLLPRDGSDQPGYLFNDLRSMALNEWSTEQKTVVFCLYLIRRAGFRCEEFSGRQLTLLGLVEWLRDKRDTYCALVQAGGTSDSLLGMADELFAAKQATKRTHFTYRVVNGMNFNKREALGQRSDICLAVAKLPRAYTRFVAKEFKVHAERHLSIDTYARSTIDSLLGEATQHGFNAAFENLLGVLVKSATEELSSDIGMSRSPRDLFAWACALATRDYEQICAWPSTEYFTAVYASSQYEGSPEVTPKDLYASLYSIAGRMTYNSWHYAPGQGPVEAVPSGRHFFFPPRMSDIGVVSNQHHGGHVLAKINHSIRSPAGLLINGVKHYGLVDLRFVRCSGAPYGYAELVRSRELTALARAVYQAVLNRAVQDKHHYRVEAFTKEWYMERYLAKPTQDLERAYGT